MTESSAYTSGRGIWWTALIVLVLLIVFPWSSVFPQESDTQGPMGPPKFEVKRIPTEPHPGPPPIPQAQLIQEVAAKEDAAQAAYAAYQFAQQIRVEELDDSGGKFTVIGESYVKADGNRYWRMTSPIVSTLHTVRYDMGDVQTMVSIPLFFLTSDQTENYNYLYAGQQKLDQLNTYIFQLKPKHLLRGRRLFQGIIYVDDHDMAIVESYGKFVSELTGEGDALPFKMFEAYRENFQGKYWLPSYISSDDYIDVPNSDQLHIRLVVRSSDFKPNVAPVDDAEKPALRPQKN